MSSSLTVKGYLTGANPILELHDIDYGGTRNADSAKKNKQKSSTSNEAYPILESFQVWKEFKMSTITAILGKSLETDIKEHHGSRDFSHLHPSFCQISDEDSLQALLIKHTQSTVLEALKITASDILKQEIVMARGGRARLFHGPAEFKRPLRPDWAGISDDQGNINILPGETKQSQVFSSNVLQESVDSKGRIRNPEATVLMPARQLAAYCAYSHMR